MNLENLTYDRWDFVEKKEESLIQCDKKDCKERGNYIRCYFIYKTCIHYQRKNAKES